MYGISNVKYLKSIGPEQILGNLIMIGFAEVAGCSHLSSSRIQQIINMNITFGEIANDLNIRVQRIQKQKAGKWKTEMVIELEIISCVDFSV